MNMHVGGADAQRVSFKVGDRVRLVKRVDERGPGNLGTVCRLWGSWKGAEVKFDPPFDGWGEDGLFWNCPNNSLEPIAVATRSTTFQVGDRVRAIADSPRGEVGRIHSIDDDYGHTYYLVEFDTWRGGHEGDDAFPDDRGWWLNAWELERLPLTVTAGRHYKTRSGDVVGPMEIDDIGFLGYVDGYGCIFDGGGGHVFGDSDLDLVEEVAAPALRIEAGKFYRTRDGRKVGPMERTVYGTHWTPDGGARRYNSDGSRRFGVDDGTVIVAEWPTYTSCAAAEVDNLADEYGGGVKPKFKVGDRVVCPEVPEAGVGIIEVVKPEGGYTVDYRDTWYAHCHGDDDTLAAAPPSPAIVARLDNGQPRPSSNPYVHADRASAEREAARLASANPGKEFAVYEFVSSAKEERRYEHEWQRLAAGGERVRAICNLRDAAGLHYDGAKAAVDAWLMRAA